MPIIKIYPPGPLDVWADLSAIVTGIIAIIAYIQFGLRRFRQRLRLERYLRGEAPGARTPLHLVAAVGMTEADVLDAAFRSKKIEFLTAADPQTGRADAIFLQFKS